MQPINIIQSKAVPLPLPNIDTDQIIPKQFLKRIERTGYRDFLFFDWRRIQEGLSAGELNPDFVLNRPEYQGAEILITERNFGCGSSREHAAWALRQYGFRVVITPTFADIFSSNASKNGVLLVRLSEEQVQTLLSRTTANPEHQLTVSLQHQTVTATDGLSAHFEIDPFRKYYLLDGLDDIDLTLRHEHQLNTFESKHDKDLWFLPKGAV
jgi:3-isopropylmalate/(R)-2-methylmalate dehydratase small subunit